MKFEYMKTNSPLRAQGNLGYIQFLQLLQKIWTDSHPDIPLVAEGTKQFLESYPIIVYRLDLRKTLQNEPKPRYREEIVNAPGEQNIIIQGQRFQNIVTFVAITNENPQLAEEIIEAFEDFMIWATPVFKALGLSDLLYARRLPDTNGDRGKGLGVVQRSVSYLVTTEKIIVTPWDQLQQVIIDARIFVQNPYWSNIMATPATPIVMNIVDQFTTDATPVTPTYFSSD